MSEKIEAGDYFIVDQGDDSEESCSMRPKAGIIPVIPRKSNSKKPNPELDALSL